MESTSKVPLKLSSRINIGRRGVRAPSSRVWTQATSLPPPQQTSNNASPEELYTPQG